MSDKWKQMESSRPGPFLPVILPQFADAPILYYFHCATIYDRGHDMYAGEARDRYLELIKQHVKRLHAITSC